MQDSHLPLHIHIICEPGIGIAEILTGYLYHYALAEITVSRFPHEQNLPYIAEKVMHEDGIHVWDEKNAPIVSQQLVIRINNKIEIPSHVQHSEVVTLSLPIPAQLSGSLAAYRTLREDIKRLAIELVGKTQLAISK